MTDKVEDSLEDVFEEILEEFQSGKRDRAAELQARAIAETTEPDALFRAYLLIRAKKITSERALSREKAETDYKKFQEKVNAKRKKQREVKEAAKRAKLVGVAVIIFVLTISWSIANDSLAEFAIGLLIFLFLLPSILKRIF